MQDPFLVTTESQEVRTDPVGFLIRRIKTLVTHDEVISDFDHGMKVYPRAPLTQDELARMDYDYNQIDQNHIDKRKELDDATS